MLKGVNRNVIVIKTDRDSRFETAYFILRPHSFSEREKSGAVAEAKGLLAAGEGEEKRAAARRKKLRKILLGALCFVLGAVFGAGAVILIEMLLR